MPRSIKTTSLRHFALAALVLLVFSAILSGTAFSAAPAEPGVKLTILHVNDTHGHLNPFVDKAADAKNPVGGVAYLALLVTRERDANRGGVVLLSAGDMFQGTPISNLFHGRPVIEVMNFLHYDAMALGNHEFDWGQDVLREIISSAHFPVLCANILDGNGKPFDGVRPWIIIERKGVKIGIIGLTTREVQYTTKPGNLTGLHVEAPAQTAAPLVKELRAKGTELVVVLSHLGLDEDRRLAREVHGIDVIVGGHSHTVVTNPVNEGGTIIVQAGCYGEYLGVLNLMYDPVRKKIASYTGKNELRLVTANRKVRFDPKVVKIIDPYNRKVREQFSKTVGTAALDLTRNPRGESNLGDLIADAMRETSGARIAIENSGGIRADLFKGPITLEQIYTVLPFDNVVVTMDLTGDQILKLLERGVRSGKGLQISGLKVEYDLSKPAGSKVASASVDGKPLAPASIYRVATNDFLAAGGDLYTEFKEGPNVVFGSELRDVVTDYITRHSPISIKAEGRLVYRK